MCDPDQDAPAEHQETGPQPRVLDLDALDDLPPTPQPTTRGQTPRPNHQPPPRPTSPPPLPPTSTGISSPRGSRDPDPTTIVVSVGDAHYTCHRPPMWTDGRLLEVLADDSDHDLGGFLDLGLVDTDQRILIRLAAITSLRYRGTLSS